MGTATSVLIVYEDTRELSGEALAVFKESAEDVHQRLAWHLGAAAVQAVGSSEVDFDAAVRSAKGRYVFLYYVGGLDANGRFRCGSFFGTGEEAHDALASSDECQQSRTSAGRLADGLVKGRTYATVVVDGCGLEPLRLDGPRDAVLPVRYNTRYSDGVVVSSRDSGLIASVPLRCIYDESTVQNPRAVLTTYLSRRLYDDALQLKDAHRYGFYYDLVLDAIFRAVYDSNCFFKRRDDPSRFVIRHRSVDLRSPFSHSPSGASAAVPTNGGGLLPGK